MSDVPEGARCAGHPDRPALMLCTRCGSYACDACQRTAADQRLCRDCHDRVGETRTHFGDASKGQRIANVVIDGLVGQALLLVPLAIWDQALGARSMDAVPSALVMFVYYLGLEGALGVTLGKLVTRTRVIHVDGTRPSFGAIVNRTLIRFIPLEGLSFLRSAPGWHDDWSSTRVVRTTPPK